MTTFCLLSICSINIEMITAITSGMFQVTDIVKTGFDDFIGVFMISQ